MTSCRQVVSKQNKVFGYAKVDIQVMGMAERKASSYLNGLLIKCA